MKQSKKAKKSEICGRVFFCGQKLLAELTLTKMVIQMNGSTLNIIFRRNFFSAGVMMGEAAWLLIDCPCSLSDSTLSLVSTSIFCMKNENKWSKRRKNKKRRNKRKLGGNWRKGRLKGRTDYVRFGVEAGLWRTARAIHAKGQGA